MLGNESEFVGIQPFRKVNLYVSKALKMCLLLVLFIFSVNVIIIYLMEEKF